MSKYPEWRHELSFYQLKARIIECYLSANADTGWGIKPCWRSSLGGTHRGRFDREDNPDFGIGRWGGVEMQWVSTAFDRHKLAFGGEYQHDWRRDQISFNGEGFQYFDSRISSNRWGLYVLDEFALNQDTDLGVGLRYDRSAEGKGRFNLLAMYGRSVQSYKLSATAALF